MSEKSQIKSGIVLSYINLIVGNLIPLFYTPIMLRILGQNEYGLYSLATSVTSYLSLMSLGIGSAVVRYLVKFRTQGDTEGESKMLGLFSCIFYGISILSLIAGIVIAFNLDLIYGAALTPSELSKIKILTILITLNTAISFAFTVYSSVVIAHERFIFQQVINIITTILPAFINIVVLLLGFASIGLAIASISLTIVANVVKIVYCHNVLKIKPIYHDMPTYLLKELLSFSFFIFLVNITNVLHSATDKVIIGAYLGTAATAIYNIGLTFRNIVQSLSTSISSILVPKVTSLVDKNATKEELSEIFVRVGRLQFILVGLAVGGFCAFGKAFVTFYAGNDYAHSYYVAILLMIPMVVPLIQNVGVSIINALNKHQFRSIVTLITAILNVITTIWLVQSWGIIGAAFTTFSCNIIGSVLLMNWYYYKKIGLNIPYFWKEIFKLAVIPICLTVISLITGHFVNFTNIAYFIIGVIIYAALYVLLMLKKLNEYEKSVFFSLFKKLMKKA